MRKNLFPSQDDPWIKWCKVHANREGVGRRAGRDAAEKKRPPGAERTGAM
jgi:hypothetical protein